MCKSPPCKIKAIFILLLAGDTIEPFLLIIIFSTIIITLADTDTSDTPAANVPRLLWSMAQHFCAMLQCKGGMGVDVVAATTSTHTATTHTHKRVNSIFSPFVSSGGSRWCITSPVCEHGNKESQNDANENNASDNDAVDVFDIVTVFVYSTNTEICNYPVL